MDRWQVCLLALALCTAPVRTHGEQPFIRGSDVAFTIRTDHKRYEIGESIVVRYTVKNVSNAALFVPKSQWEIKCGDPPHVWVRLEDSSGKHEPGYFGSCLGPSPEDQMSVTERMRKDAVLLEPGQSVDGSFTFESKVLRTSNLALTGWRRFCTGGICLSVIPSCRN